MSKQNKQIVKLNNYKRKAYWRTVADVFKYGYTGKIGNLIDFKFYKTDKAINKFANKYLNDNKICAITIVIGIIICLIIWFK